MIKHWYCRVGANFRNRSGSNNPVFLDKPFRTAVEKTFLSEFGFLSDFCFSGWEGELSEDYVAVIENRTPNNAKLIQAMLNKLKLYSYDFSKENADEYNKAIKIIEDVVFIEMLRNEY